MEAWIPSLLTLAVLAPLIAFFAILATGRALPRGGRPAYWIALAAITASLALSTVAATFWHATTNGSLARTLHAHEPTPEGAKEASPLGPVPAADALAEEVPRPAPRTLTGRLLFVARFDALSIEIAYLVDGLTILFFPLICGVATCVIVYAGTYMEDETTTVVDKHATGEDDGPVRRPGRYARFFQFMALFCFAMLGLVLVGDLLGVFVFWELVGAASYFLIGFYVERESANAAANKAFFVNRIGDFGMLSGIAMFLGAFGTLAIADRTNVAADSPFARGLSTQVAQRLLPGGEPTREVHAPLRSTESEAVAAAPTVDPIWPFGNWRVYLTVAGALLFCGCVGKSAQVPLHVWLPDAMEGPTPVSALVHSATMVAAGVYLLGRVYPLLLPETLVVVAIVGVVTALAGAAMATVASDLKKALAFSTMSQLGLMTLSMGVGGWFAGLFHLATHAFFKCLLFLGAGAVQHGAGTLDLNRLGGLGRKMPLTAGLMLVGAVALAGLGLPLLVLPGLGLAGFHSKDAILEQIFVFAQEQPWGWSLFGLAALVGALTAYYIGRIWLLIFRDRPKESESSERAERHEDHDASHAHDPSWKMALPMAVLAFLAIVAGWTGWQSAVAAALFAAGAIVVFLRSRSTGSAWTKPAIYAAGAFAVWAALATVRALWFPEISLQATLQSAMPVDLATAGTHDEGALLARAVAGLVALGAALTGLLLAWRRFGSASRPPLQEPAFLRPVRSLLVRRFYVDEAYRSTFVEGYFAMTNAAAALDRWIFDRAVDGIADGGREVARLWTKWVDERFVDGGFDGFGLALLRGGMRLRLLQSGRLRQYVFFLAAAAIGLFVLVFFFLDAEAALERLRAATKSR